MWQDILKTAIIGTERNALALPARNDALGTVLATLDTNSRESSLLSAAATMALYERAGQVPTKDSQPLPVPAEADDVPCCNARAAQHLSLMLSGEYKDVLPEWFAALATANKRVPDESLPALLALGKTNKSLRDAIRKVIGKRGLWLARQNFDWDYIVTSLDESHWQTGTRNTRLALLQQLRATDPARARELAASTWNEEKPEDRVAFIAAFMIGLSMEDEPFLEAALDDRRKEVRKAAAELLARLPASALVKRMIERVTPLIKYKLNSSGKGEFIVNLPDHIDKTMQRDGIDPKPPHSSIGEKSWRLRQIISATPLEYWVRQFKEEPDKLCKAARTSEWYSSFTAGWSEAAERFGDLIWIDALLNDQTENEQIAHLFQLFDKLTPAHQELIVLSRLNRESPLHPDKAVYWLLKDHMKFSWSNEFSLQIAKTIEAQLRMEGVNLQLLWSEWAKAIGNYFCVEAFPTVITVLTDATEGDLTKSNWVQDFAAALQFRHNMLKEISQ